MSVGVSDVHINSRSFITTTALSGIERHSHVVKVFLQWLKRQSVQTVLGLVFVDSVRSIGSNTIFTGELSGFCGSLALVDFARDVIG